MGCMYLSMSTHVVQCFVWAELILHTIQNMAAACMQTQVVGKDGSQSGIMPTVECSFVEAECRGDICAKQNPNTQVQTTEVSCNPKNASQVLFDGGMHAELCAVDIDFWIDLIHSDDTNFACSHEYYLADLDAVWGVSVAILCNDVSVREPTDAILAKSQLFCMVLTYFSCRIPRMSEKWHGAQMWTKT